MTATNFQKYCKKNKILKVETDACQIVFYFKNGKRIDVSCGYDGFEYRFWSKPKPNATKGLVDDLNLLMPNYYKNLTEKYLTAF